MARMVLVAIGIGMLAAIAPARASEWTAEIVDVEGGSAMMASVVGPGAGEGLPPELFMFCFEGSVNLRYAFEADGNLAQFMDGTVPFTFEFGSGAVTLDMQYEDMDAAFAADVPETDRIIGLFKSAATVIVDDPTGLYRPQSFPLTGSSVAIDTLLEQCGQAGAP